MPRPAFAPPPLRNRHSRSRPSWWPAEVEYLDECEFVSCHEPAVNYVATIRVDPVRRQPSRIVRPRCAGHTYERDEIVG